MIEREVSETIVPCCKSAAKFDAYGQLYTSRQKLQLQLARSDASDATLSHRGSVPDMGAPTRLKSTVFLLFCVAGIYGSYLTQGVVQEALSTKQFGADGARFAYLSSLNAVQCWVCFLWAALLLVCFDKRCAESSCCLPLPATACRCSIPGRPVELPCSRCVAGNRVWSTRLSRPTGGLLSQTVWGLRVACTPSNTSATLLRCWPSRQS